MAQDYEGFLLRKRLRDTPRQWYNEGFISEDDFDHILEMIFAEYRLNQFNMKQYSDMCDLSRSALLAKNHGQDAVDDYTEFEDSLDNFEVIALALGYAKNPTAASGIAKKSFLPFGRSCFAVARHIIEECYNIEKMMGSLADYFDYERYGRELFMYDYNMGADRFSALLRKETAMCSAASDPSLSLLPTGSFRKERLCFSILYIKSEVAET